MLPRYEIKLAEIRSSISNLLQEIILSSEDTLKAFEENKNEFYVSAKNRLKNLQLNANAIDNLVIRAFALFGPEANELRTLVAYLKMTNDLERIGDSTYKYAKRLEEHCKGECDLSPLTNAIIQLHKTTLNALQYIHTCLIDTECDADELYRKVIVEESKNDDLFSLMEKDLLKLIIDSDEIAVEYVRVLGTLRKLERSGDRAVNIAALLLFAKNGGELHMYN